ncbi:MAG TPA: flagellar GTP-binding protein [Candidatus Didemnitutus sp.]|jgi:flagellar biosynthesis protein FlhF
MNSASIPTTPGTCFRFTVASAEQAAAVIRERLGENARVLSVRNVPARGLTGLFGAPRLEVIAQVVPKAATELAPIAPAAPAAADPESVRRQARARFRATEQSLSSLLLRSGFSSRLLQRLQQTSEWSALEQMPLHRALVETGRHLRDQGAARHIARPLTRAAFIGGPGAGRTTALCKWLAVEVFRRARIGHVVTAEFDRPNPPGALTVFCEALGVPLAHYPALTQPATPGGFVYFDLPGLSVRNPADNASIAAFLEREAITDRVLVLNAAYSDASLRAAYVAGRDLGATHVIFTHLDEVTQWGRLWDFVLDDGLEPLFLATGPSLTGDCEESPLDAIARRTLPEPEAVAEPAADDEAGEPSTLNTAA